MKTTQKQKILSCLQGRKRPLTAVQIADKTGVRLSSTRVLLSGLQTEGLVTQAGAQSSAIGRPSNLYLLS